MNKHLSLLFAGIFALTIFTGCVNKKAQPLACFKGSPSCITQQHVQTHKETQCKNCFAIL